jgi:glutathionylspermidine synthase
VTDAALVRYRNARKEFFTRHGSRWPETLADEFDLLAARVLSRPEVDEILEAAASIARIYDRAAQFVPMLSEEALSELGVPAHLWRLVRSAAPNISDCVVGRLDMAQTGNGYKLLEFNSDAAGLVVEAFSVNSAICQHDGRVDPNGASESILIQTLGDTVRAGLNHVEKSPHEESSVVVAFTGHCARDAAVARYLCGLMESFPVHDAAITSLSIDETGLYDGHGKRVNVLYRLFPLDYLRDDLFKRRDPTDGKRGGLLLSLIERRKLVVINPPLSFVLESKALQAVIWNLAATGSWFTSEERAAIAHYMLPTFLDPPGDHSVYVVKPVYGHEGDTIRVIGSDGSVKSRSTRTTYSEKPMVYQQHVPLPAPRLMTEFGRRQLHVVTSCFLVGGNPTAICMRAGKRITDESAWVLPVCIR